MAKHKLQPEEIQRAETAKVLVETIGIYCTKITDTWASSLSAIIAQRYCCKAYRHHEYKGKKVEIGFAGLEDDFHVCKRIFLYAYKYVKARCKDIKAEHEGRGWSTKEIREMCNTYGWGFYRGLEAAFKEQEAEHQEWGLVMVVPQAVHDATASHKKPSVYGTMQTAGWRKKYADAGYEDGQKFDPAHSLGQQDETRNALV